MGVHSEIIVLLYPVAWLKSFVFHEKHENKWPGGLFLYSLPLLLEKHTEEKKSQTVEESNK